eukprot:1922473-Pleurochrysis_carterae.AAC.2
MDAATLGAIKSGFYTARDAHVSAVSAGLLTRFAASKRRPLLETGIGSANRHSTVACAIARGDGKGCSRARALTAVMQPKLAMAPTDAADTFTASTSRLPLIGRRGVNGAFCRMLA